MKGSTKVKLFVGLGVLFYGIYYFIVPNIDFLVEGMNKMEIHEYLALFMYQLLFFAFVDYLISNGNELRNWVFYSNPICLFVIGIFYFAKGLIHIYTHLMDLADKHLSDNKNLKNENHKSNTVAPD